MRILHLSDFHFGHDTFFKTQKILDSIIKALIPFNDNVPIDFVVCTGDLINQGAKDYEAGIDKLFAVFQHNIIQPLLEKLNLPPERFVFCPGNHDVNRLEDSKYEENGLFSLLDSEVAISSLMQDKRCSNSVKRMVAFKKFEKNYYSNIEGIQYQYGFFESNLILNVNGVSVGISLLNSSWRSYDSKTDKGRLLIGKEQIINSLSYIDKCQVKLALSHHDIVWLADFDATEIQKQICKNYDMFFTGHTHSSHECYQIKPEGSTFNVVAPGVLSANIGVSDSIYRNGFSLIDYDLVNAQFNSRLFFQDGVSSFKLDQNHGKDGVWTIDVPIGDDARSKREVMSLVMDIRDNADKSNEHLLSYKTKSYAPKSVSQIFVEPVLSVRNMLDTINDKDTKIESITLKEVLDSDKNYIFFGIKESGKTVLLDKLMIDAASRISGCDYIPAIINFKDIHRNTVEVCINNYWQHNYKDVRRILTAEKILLLIDNIDFSDTIRMNVLSEFLSTHRNVRYIGTSLTNRLQDDNLDIYNQPLQNFIRIEIEQFKSKQIRELVAKWINSSSTKSDVQKRVDTIVDAFVHLNLPCTPFAISMFLWILERQESYRPQNNAILIKSYVENVLKDGDVSASREEFDFMNQSTVLSEIAYVMLKEDNVNYAIKSSRLQQTIEDQLHEFRFQKVYDANKIYNDFLRKGIFVVEQDNMIRFRFLCFFEYFLYLRMEKYPEFLKEILQEKKYLKFYNEILFYTGINRGDTQILQQVMEDLEYDYIEINDIVFKKVSNVDDFFNVGSSLLENITPADLMCVLPDKETENANDKQNDHVLQLSQENEEYVIRKKNSNKFNNFARLLLLAMDVLKNCEEYKPDQNHPNATKAYFYQLVLRNSISYVVLFRLIAIEMIKHQDKFSEERIQDLKFIVRMLPALHEELLREHLGTYKLTEIIKEKIDEDARVASSMSEFERFLSVFLYADMRGENYFKTLSEFLKTFKRAYIADASYFKLLSYYYSSKNINDDNKLINLLGDLYIKLNTTESRHINKSAVITSLKNRKRQKDIEDIKSSK